jgi:hypothetical protein
LLRANTIKDMVESTNALVNTQKQCNEGRYEQYKTKVTKGAAGSPSKPPSESGRFSKIDPNADRYSTYSMSVND